MVVSRNIPVKHLLWFLLIFVVRQASARYTSPPKGQVKRTTVSRELLTALWENDRAAVEQALNKGADVNYVGPAYDREDALVRSSTSALNIASELDNLSFVKLLLTRRAKLNLRDQDGNTALHSAVAEGYVDVVRVLLEHGADYRVKNSFGNTPLMLTESPDQVASYSASRATARLIRAQVRRDRLRRRRRK
jgi:ankyrin repeat protein